MNIDEGKNKAEETLNFGEQTGLPEGWARWGMGTEEGTCEEHWVSDVEVLSHLKLMLHSRLTN